MGRCTCLQSKSENCAHVQSVGSETYFGKNVTTVGGTGVETSQANNIVRCLADARAVGGGLNNLARMHLLRFC